ncbi:hypothetical protein GCM10012275_23560 [Longimycelium tulufanense]|uniref:YbaB/EbfC DNA-binding family protein n=1 Tax=Longimycelium tulufanense TaxID=907463 RepID=A0A8J3CC62_9PSEU|nr:YbaB/EbfC family nucleoid-associated protein [Longimycelium tulufanense]GGM51920.1 hypothetical protein GCM10012275_23560 [Longimycelium tulufanense]
MTAEFDQLQREFERFQQSLRRVDDRLERYSGMQDEIAAVSVTAHSADRCVNVTAGPGGAVTGIEFTEKALQQSPQALGSMVMSTLQEAVAGAARQQAAVVQQFVGDDLNVLDQVLETQAQMLGRPVEELRAGLEPSAPARPSEEEDFAERSVMRDDDPTPPASPGRTGDPTSPGDAFLRSLYNREDD